MVTPLPNSLPKPHRDFLDHAIEKLAHEFWLLGIVATGSFATDTMDAFSDLDFVLAVAEEEHATVMENRIAIAEALGPLLSAFTGEHVGQPRLLLCLYGPPLLHVDMIFDTLPDLVRRTDDLVILWERDERLSTALSGRTIIDPEPDPQWIEDRFWVWTHKAAGKIGRGELFEAIEYLAFLRSRVLGPLGLHAASQRPTGVRRIELAVPSLADDLMPTLANHRAGECLAALRACVELYRQFRAIEGLTLQYRHGAERAVTDYLDEIGTRLAGN